MIQGKELKSVAIKYLVIMGLWTVVSLLISSITFLTFMQEGFSMGVFEVIIYEFLCISPWIVLTPAIMWLARTYRFEKNAIYSSVGVHLAAAAVVFSLHSVVQSYTSSLYYDISFTWTYVERDFLGFLDMRVMLYTGILLAIYAIDFQKKNREIRLKEPLLKAELNKAKFHALLNQIQPNFLLNSIESIKDNLDDSVEQSEEILTEFSDLLRIMLANVNREEVTLREDLESYFLYTSILKKRLKQTIDIETTIGEDCYEAVIPSFLILIPVFEQIFKMNNLQMNAIQGVSYKAEHILDKIHLETKIEGEKIPSNRLPEILGGIGFPDIIEKLHSKYGNEAEFKTQTDVNSISIKFVLPFTIARDNAGIDRRNSHEKIKDLYL